MEANLQTIEHALNGAGFDYRGGFHPAPDDGVPDCGFTGSPASVIMVGNIGGAMWDAFAAARRDEPDAMDNWTRRTLGAVAHDLDIQFGGVVALYPFGGPPYHPFQRWAMRAEPVHASPIGPLIHPQYGLWHAYRGALVFRAPLDLPQVATQPSPCDSCTDKPCLNTCPVGAFSADGYDVPRCGAHLDTVEGDLCLTRGCLARRACPVGRDYAYGEAQTRFHMGLFRDLHAPR